MILYFTGTGNSRYIARAIAEATGDSLLSVNERLKRRMNEKISSELPLVVVVPTYAWRMPRTVSSFILRTDFDGNRKAYFILTCGDGMGAAEKYIRKLCRAKHFQFMGCSAVVMPENYIAMFAAPPETEAREIIRKSESVVADISQKIKSGLPLHGQKITLGGILLSGIVNPVFYKLYVKAGAFYATDACVGCGRCVKACPLNNVELENGRPAWGKECTHCMACICGCPTQAIEYGKSSRGKERYQCLEYPIKK